MHEKQPNHAEVGLHPDPWIEGDVQQILDSDRAPVADTFYGHGEGHVFGPERTAFLALYPEHQTIELISESVVISPRRAARVTAIPEHLFFDIQSEREHTMLTVGRDGTVSLLSGQVARELTPHEEDIKRLLNDEWERVAGSPDLAPIDHNGTGRLNGGETAGSNYPEESSAMHKEAANDSGAAPSVEPIIEPPVSDSVAPWEVQGSGSSSSRSQPVSGQTIKTGDTGASPVRSPEPEDRRLSGGGKERKEEHGSPSDSGVITRDGEADTAPASSTQPEKKQARVELTGRIGRLPHFKETPRGKSLARFPVAEHSKDEAGEDVTTWYTVAAFNALAESLKAQVESGELKQGEEVRVVGYLHNRMAPDGKGGLKPVEEIFAAVVKKPSKKGGK